MCTTRRISISQLCAITIPGLVLKLWRILADVCGGVCKSRIARSCGWDVSEYALTPTNRLWPCEKCIEVSHLNGTQWLVWQARWNRYSFFICPRQDSLSFKARFFSLMVFLRTEIRHNSCQCFWIACSAILLIVIKCLTSCLSVVSTAFVRKTYCALIIAECCAIVIVTARSSLFIMALTMRSRVIGLSFEMLASFLFSTKLLSFYDNRSRKALYVPFFKPRESAGILDFRVFHNRFCPFL